MSKPSLPRGTRDFGPDVTRRRTFILDTIRAVFRKYGFQPIETPALEQLSVLTGKYGDEGDQLIFKVLNSGDYLSKRGQRVVTATDLDAGERHLTPLLSEKALRYDLTVPFARFVAMNRHALTFPFRRYQVQPVWRADRPQKGRYREFYQCDADVVGTDSLLCEAEIVMMIAEVMRGLGIDDYALKVNHRQVLADMAARVGAPGQEASLSVAIDKLDKIGWEGVAKELSERGFAPEAAATLQQLADLPAPFEARLGALSDWLGVPDGQGLRDLSDMWTYLQEFGADTTAVQLDPTLARGLSYYTGAIFEVKVNHVAIGSVSGGGRYDNLTGVFGLPDVSGVGISFGIDRLYDVLDALERFPDSTAGSTRVLVAQFDATTRPAALRALARLRAAGISAEMYPDAAKLKKQFSYADQKGIRYVVLIGSEEAAADELSVKNLQTGTQRRLPVESLVSELLTED